MLENKARYDNSDNSLMVSTIILSSKLFRYQCSFISNIQVSIDSLGFDKRQKEKVCFTSVFLGFHVGDLGGVQINRIPYHFLYWLSSIIYIYIHNIEELQALNIETFNFSSSQYIVVIFVVKKFKIFLISQNSR